MNYAHNIFRKIAGRNFRSIISIALLSVFALTCKAYEHWDRRVSLFDSLPVHPSDIVFLGNSITEGGEFSELFAMENIKNRGISSDVIDGVQRRLYQVTDGHPAKIFLLIGINDVSHNLSVDTLAARYERLVDDIIKRAPDSKLYIQSVMPINNDFNRYKGLKGKEKTVTELNKRISRIAADRGLTYIDLWPTLAGSDGKLRKIYTNDGLHLKGAGYKAWVKAIDTYVRE